MTAGRSEPAAASAGRQPGESAAAAPVRRVALIGNPNTGKSTLFNALTGLQARVANYPGVTVEKKTGMLGDRTELIDLPGTYSLAAHSPDELVAVQVLRGDLVGERRPDLVVVIVDASNLPRNLFLATQVIDTGVPTILALNMVDAAAAAGTQVDAAKVSAALGVPVFATVASRGQGMAELKAAICAPTLPTPATPAWPWPEPLQAEIDRLAAEFAVDRFTAARALIDAEGAMEAHFLALHGAPAQTALSAARARLTEQSIVPAKAEAQMRYGWIARAMQPCIVRGERPAGGDTTTDRLDNLLTHRLFGSLAFVALMTLVFVSIFLLAQPFMEWIDAGFGWLGGAIQALFAGSSIEGGMLESLVVDGAIPGVGGVLIFLPQIVLLFLFIAILEDSGYMSRAAFLMDRVLRFCGLSGHSFIPMMSSFACAIPGIMATRTIANPRDRLTTILVAPLMSCSARIPVYGLLCAAFVPSQPLYGMLPGLVFAAMYFVGILTAVPVAWVLKKTILKGPPPPFVLELPQYRLPVWRNVGVRVWIAAREFVVRAGTAIFAVSLVVWALLYFPHADSIKQKYAVQRAALEAPAAAAPVDPQAAREAADARGDQLALLDRQERGEYLRESLLGRFGHTIEPAVRPLGWDWRIGVGALASFPAREVIVSTLRIIYDLDADSDDVGDLSQKLQAATWPDGRKVYSLPVALSIMVFFALCAQCAATLVTIRKESGSWKWAGFAFLYMTSLAYLGALITYQGGMWIMSLL